MNLPSFRRLLSSDYPKQFQALIDKLSVPLNYGIEVLYDALHRSLTFRDNFNATVKDVSVTVDANGIPNQSTSMSINITGKVDGILVIGATNSKNSTTYPTSGVFVSGVQSNNTFVINNVTGLQPNQAYSLRVVILGQN